MWIISQRCYVHTFLSKIKTHSLSISYSACIGPFRLNKGRNGATSQTIRVTQWARMPWQKPRRIWAQDFTGHHLKAWLPGTRGLCLPASMSPRVKMAPRGKHPVSLQPVHGQFKGQRHHVWGEQSSDRPSTMTTWDWGVPPPERTLEMHSPSFAVLLPLGSKFILRLQREKKVFQKHLIMNLEEFWLCLRFLDTPKDPEVPSQCLKVPTSFNNATIPILTTSKAKFTVPQNPEFFSQLSPMTHHTSFFTSRSDLLTAPSGVLKNFTYFLLHSQTSARKKQHVHLFLHFLFQAATRKHMNSGGQTTSTKK